MPQSASDQPLGIIDVMLTPFGIPNNAIKNRLLEDKQKAGLISPNNN